MFDFLVTHSFSSLTKKNCIQLKRRAIVFDFIDGFVFNAIGALVPNPELDNSYSQTSSEILENVWKRDIAHAN